MSASDAVPVTRALVAALAVLAVVGSVTEDVRVDPVQDRPALKDVFKGAFVIGTAVNSAIVSGNDEERT